MSNETNGGASVTLATLLSAGNQPGIGPLIAEKFVFCGFVAMHGKGLYAHAAKSLNDAIEDYPLAASRGKAIDSVENAKQLREGRQSPPLRVDLWMKLINELRGAPIRLCKALEAVGAGWVDGNLSRVCFVIVRLRQYYSSRRIWN